MPAGAVVIIIVACVLIATAAGIAATLELRIMATRRQFGPEFDRLARRMGHRRARTEVIARKRHVAGLGLRPLSPERNRQLSAAFTAAQEQFVEAPADAVEAAGDLVLSAASEVGYPSGDREQLLADLSVRHSRRLEGYRRAQETAAQAASASTEDLRQAMLRFRTLFQDLATERPGGGGPGGGRRLPWAGALAAGPLMRRARPQSGTRPRSGRRPQPRWHAPRVRLSVPRVHLRKPRLAPGPQESGAPREPRLRRPHLPRVTRPSAPRLLRRPRPSPPEGANQP
jgi:hypothetical protein